MEMEATGAPQNHYHTLNQQVGSITLTMHACLDLPLKILWIFGNTKRHKNTLPLSWLLNLVTGLLLN